LRLRDNAHLSATASTLAIPRGKLLDYRPDQFEHRFSSSPLAANKIVSINHASNAARFPACRGFIVRTPASALNHNVLFSPGYFRGSVISKLYI